MSQLQDLNHKHILVSATHLKRMPEFTHELNEWLSRLVTLVGMKILMGPYCIRCDTLGNEGLTGVVVIETSHCSIHMWTECEIPFLKMDLYSCKDFDEKDVIEMVKEFDPVFIGYNVLDRNSDYAKQLTRNFIVIEENVNVEKEAPENPQAPQPGCV